MNTPIRLTPADHVLIHGVGTLLLKSHYSDAAEDQRWAETVQKSLRCVLPDITHENLHLAQFERVADEMVDASYRRLNVLASTRQTVLWDYHRTKLAGAWDMIRERYPHA